MISADQSFTEVPPSTIFADRRTQPRCSIQLPIEFRVVGGEFVGQGVVLNMCSTGIAFHSKDAVQCGCFVDVKIPWFSNGEFGCATTLIAYGRVVWKNQELSAIQVLRRKFHRQELSSNLEGGIVPTDAEPFSSTRERQACH